MRLLVHINHLSFLNTIVKTFACLHNCVEQWRKRQKPSDSPMLRYLVCLNYFLFCVLNYYWFVFPCLIISCHHEILLTYLDIPSSDIPQRGMQARLVPIMDSDHATNSIFSFKKLKIWYIFTCYFESRLL